MKPMLESQVWFSWSASCLEVKELSSSQPRPPEEPESPFFKSENMLLSFGYVKDLRS